MKVKEIIKLIEADGWYVARQKGSHKQYKHLIIFEKNTQGHFGAFVPDLPGCVSIGDTLTEAKKNIKEAIELHIEGMEAEGYIISEPSSFADSVVI